MDSWVTFFALAILLVGLPGLYFWLFRHYRRTVIDRLVWLGQTLRSFKQEEHDLRELGKDYTPRDPRPFGPIAGKLKKQFSGIAAHHYNLARERRTLLQNLPQRTARRLSRLWQIVAGHAIAWFRIDRAGRNLERETGTLQAEHDDVRDLLEELRTQGWKVAKRAAETQRNVAKIQSILTDLSSKGVRGEAFGIASTQRKSLSQKLTSLPRYFFGNDRAEVLQKASVASTADAYKVLQTIEPNCDDLSVRVKRWREAYGNAFRAVEAMQKGVDALDSKRKGMPKPIDLSEFDLRFDAALNSAHSVGQEFGAPLVDHLPEIEKKGVKIKSEADDLLAQLNLFVRHYDSLRHNIDGNAQQLEKLSTQLGTLATTAIYPVIWENKKSKFGSLKALAKEIGAITKVRTPSALKSDLARSDGLKAQIDALARVLQKTAHSREGLVALWTGTSLKQDTTWLSSVEDLSHQIGRYSVENWGEKLSVNRLVDDARNLLSRQRSLVPGSQSQPIKEHEIEFLLQASRQLVEDFEAFDNRSVKIRSRFAELQKTEDSARQIFVETRKAMERAHELLASPSSLSTLDGQAITVLTRTAAQLDDQLRESASGLIDKKVQEVKAWNDKSEQVLKGLVRKAGESITAKRDNLDAKLKSLLVIAPLREQPAIKLAQPLRSMTVFALDMPAIRISEQTKVTGLVEQLDQERRTLRELNDALAAVEKEVEGPLRDVIEEFEIQRTDTKKQLSVTYEILPSHRTWPPVSIKRDEFEKMWAESELRRRNLAKSGSTVVQVRKELRALIKLYGKTESKADIAAEKAREDAKEVAALIHEIGQLRRQWQTRLLECSNDPIASSIIKRLLAEISSEKLDSLKADYLGGASSYTRVLENLKSIRMKAAHTTVPTTSGQNITIYGSVMAQTGGHINIRQDMSNSGLD